VIKGRGEERKGGKRREGRGWGGLNTPKNKFCPRPCRKSYQNQNLQGLSDAISTHYSQLEKMFVPITTGGKSFGEYCSTR
jgi:hypothetical protein